jgi:hypothetical protein
LDLLQQRQNEIEVGLLGHRQSVAQLTRSPSSVTAARQALPDRRQAEN